MDSDEEFVVEKVPHGVGVFVIINNKLPFPIYYTIVAMINGFIEKMLN